MRTKGLVAAFALLLVSAGVARGQSGQSTQSAQSTQSGQSTQSAQTASQPAEAPIPSSPLTIDVGFRVSSVDGDRARFERYQDLRSSGLNLNLWGSTEGESWVADYAAHNVGYHDQQYAGSFSGMGKVFANVSFFQLPLNYGFADDGYVRTPYTGGNNNLQLDDATQSAAQAGRVLAWTANPTQSSAWVGLAHPIDLGSRRSQFDGSLVYSPTSTIDLNVGVTSYKRSGTQPWGASWGFSSASEVPLTLDNRTTNFTVGAAFTVDQLGLQFAFDNSAFTNNSEVLTWDNPGTLTDSLTKGAGRGVMSVMPGNSMTTFRGTGVYRLPERTSVSASFAVSRLDQDEALIPITSNSLLGPTAPGRTSAQAKADVSMFNIAFNSRPTPKLWFTGRYRYRNFTQKTPPYVSAVTVFDTSITAEDSVEPSEYLDVKNQNLQLGASYALVQYATVRFDYLRNMIDQTIREWPSETENIERVSLDSVGSQWASLRATYEHSTRRGSGTYDVPDGQQPAARMYDVADRNRNGVTVMLTLMPTSMLGVTFSANAAKDDYQKADPTQQFGLLNNKNQTYTAGFDVTPSQYVSAGAAYGFSKFTGLQASRNANPPPDPTFTSPARDWFDNHEEKVHTFTANVLVTHVIPSAELEFGYDYSHSDQAYLYSGPAITRLQGLPPAAFAVGFTGQFAQLPNVIDTINRATVNVKYFVTEHLAANVTYWFDKYSTENFATPTRLDSPGALLLGYGWRPYTANTVFLNGMYRF